MYQDTLTSRLIAVPTPETLEKFRDTLSYPPVKFDPLETLHISLYKNPYNDPSILKQLDNWRFNVPMPFTVPWFGIWYDEVLGISKVSAKCTLPSDVQEKLDFINGGPRSVYMTFLHDPPPLSRAFKAFLSSVSETIVSKGDTYVFSDVFHISESEYQESFASKYIRPGQ